MKAGGSVADCGIERYDTFVCLRSDCVYVFWNIPISGVAAVA